MHYFLRISSLSPSPMVSGRSGSSRHVRKPMIGFEKSSDLKLQMCHHLYLYKSIFVVRGVWSRGASTPGTPPGAVTGVRVRSRFMVTLCALFSLMLI